MTDKEGMASMLGVSLEELDELVKAGIVEEKDGSFPVASNVQAYLSYIKTETDDEETKENYWAEKAKHEKAKRKMSELKLKKLKESMHEAKDIELLTNNMIEHIKRRVLEIPRAVAPRILGLKNPGEISQILDDEIRAVLTELSQYDPNDGTCK